MYDRLAHRYDLINRKISFGFDRRWRNKVVSAIGHHDCIIDFGAGTGDLTGAYLNLHAGTGRVILVDMNRLMIARAKQKLAARFPESSIHYVVADGDCLPFRDGCVGGIMSTFVLRNLSDMRDTIGESARISGESAMVAFLDITAPALFQRD